MASARFPQLPTPSAAIDRLTEAGVKPPKELVDLADRAEALQAVQAEAPVAYLDVPITEMAGAIRKAAINQAVEANLLVLVGTISETIDIRVANLLRQHSDGFLIQARPRFDAAATELGRVVGILGTDPNPGSFSQPADSEKIQTYFSARADSLAGMTKAADISNLLSQVGYLTGPRRAAWYLHPEDATQLAKAQRLFETNPGSPFEWLLAAGLRLHLNSAEEVEAIEAGVDPGPSPTELHPALTQAEVERTWGR